MKADSEMPQHSNVEDSTVDTPPEDKSLTPWLAQRFADRARPLAPRPAIGMTALRLPHFDRQRDSGDSNDRSEGPVITRTGRAFAAPQVDRSPIASRVSDFVLRKLTLVQTGWQQALSLPVVQRLRSPGSRARQDRPTAAETTFSGPGDQWVGSDQSGGKASGPTFGDQDQLAEKTVRGDTPVTEGTPAPTAADRSTSPVVDTKPVDQDHARHVVTQQLDMPHEAGTQVRPEFQHPDLAHRVARAVMRMTRQTGLQRSLLQPRSEIISQRITGQRAHSIGYAYRRPENQPEHRFETGAPEKGTVPFEAGPPEIKQPTEQDADRRPTLLDITVPKRPASLLSKAFGGLQRSLIKPGSRESEINRPESDTRPGMPSRQGVTISRSPASEAPPSPEVAAISYLHAPQSSAEARSEPHGGAVISRSMTGPETHEADTRTSADSDLGPADRITQRGSPHGHVSSVARSMIRSAPMIPSDQRAVGMAFRRLFRAIPDTPEPIENEDREVPQSRGYEPSSPSYEYARQPAPTMPLVSGVSPGAGFTAADNAELFRYASDVSPQIDHSGNHNGLYLPPATVSRAADTGSEPQAAAPELPQEKSEDKQAAPDIRALAREVYPLIKRMIMIERDRHPAWY